ncbi:hypothetical protein KC678_01605 [Candidatus Dojkabacteria bacterium]|uniref:FtsQ-type POTRA domain-containing protein n=1 Tax=Candidatus Dojkabacteria bacterium TaxID=2099670 RepID=A0A955IB13_9BACT|nr:hypothetical protein [Candidatus Dojkabacteria bacterium]
MRLPFFRKKENKNLPKYGAGSHKHLRDGNTSKLSLQQLKKIRLPKIGRKQYKFRYVSILYILIVLLFLGTLYVLFISDVFKVKKIVIESANIDIKESVERAYLNSNIFFLPVTEVEHYVSDNIKFSKQIFVRKIYPDELEVKVKEVTPKFYYLDFHQYALFDEENNVIELEAIPSSLEFSAEEQKWLAGELDTESLFIQERYFESLSEDEISNFDWSKVPLEIKQNLVAQVETQVQQKIYNYFATQETFLKQQLGEYPIIKFYGYSDAEDVISGSKIISQSLKLTEDLSKIIQDYVINIVWKNTFRAEVTLPDGKIIIFGEVPDSSIEDQIKNFIILYNSSEYGQQNIFDLRSTNFSGRK